MATQNRSNKRRRQDLSGQKNRGFRLSGVGIILACLCGAMGTFKVFKVSPENSSRNVRVSGVDCVQSWLAKRQARIHEEAGWYPLALLAWKSCISDHPYHESNLIQALRAYVQLEHPNRHHVRDVVDYGRQLSEMMTGESLDRMFAPLVLVWMGGVTEAADLVISWHPPQNLKHLGVLASIILLGNRELPDIWMNALRDAHAEGDASAGVLGQYAIALRLGNWSDVSSGGILPDFSLTGMSDGEDLLQVLKDNLCFWVLSQSGTAEELRHWMSEYQWSGPIRNWHRLIYWRKQIEAGNEHLVWSEIKGGNHLEWLNVDQLIEWGILYQRSDQSASLIPKIHSLLKMFPSSPDLLFYYASLLGQHERWGDLQALAVRMRSRSLVSNMEGLSFFFEAEAWRGQRNPQAAKESYHKWLAAPVRLPRLEWQAARKIREAGLKYMALRRFRALEPFYEDSVSFWEEVFDFGSEMQWERYQLDACRHLCALLPDSKQYAHHLASLLLALRRDPALAITLTGSLIQRFPQDRDLTVTHIHALLQNNRLREAGRALASFHPDPIPDRIKETYQLARFETFYRELRVEDACSIAEMIRPEKLFVHQQIWLEEQVQKLKCP